jgi:DNA-binding response OmpR family regulator
MANILIIDDDVHVTRLLQSHLSDMGHKVTVAHRGEEGFISAQKATPDLIFLDVILPDATGFQMCSRFRKTPATETTPILMMTGVARFPNQQGYAMERGANEYILKPFDILEMGDMVDRYVGPHAPTGPVPKKVVTPLPPVKNVTGNLKEIANFLRKAIEKSKPNS